MIGERVNVGGIIWGLLFLGLGFMFLLDELEVWDLEFKVVGPIVLIGLGLVVVLGALFRRRG